MAFSLSTAGIDPFLPQISFLLDFLFYEFQKIDLFLPSKSFLLDFLSCEFSEGSRLEL